MDLMNTKGNSEKFETEAWVQLTDAPGIFKKLVKKEMVCTKPALFKLQARIKVALSAFCSNFNLNVFRAW